VQNDVSRLIRSWNGHSGVSARTRSGIPEATVKTRQRDVLVPKQGSTAVGRPRKVNQSVLDKMVALRQSGHSLADIAEKVGRSERTVRRYVGHVEVQLRLPDQKVEEKKADPRQMREQLARWFSDTLYDHKGSPRPRESVRFLTEANRLIQERLASTDHLTLELLVADLELRKRFLREVVGHLYVDFRSWIRFDEGCCVDASTSAASWRPPRERPPLDLEDDDL